MFPESPYVAGCTVVYDADGSSRVDDAPIVRAQRGLTRAERVRVRMASGTAMRDCVRSGYVIGRDDETRERADRALLAFLRNALAPAPAAPSGSTDGGAR